MPTNVSAEIGARVTALVVSILKDNAISADVQPNSLLADVGLTSMDMVNLMLGVESEFDLTIPQAEITPENFQSVHSIVTMLAKQMAHSVAA